MGQKTTIAWCDKTFNPIIGCHKVSPACKFCYAEQYATRYSLAKWGLETTGGTRYITSTSNWKKPLQWQKQAAKEGVVYKVFCASLSDVMEDHPTWHEVRPRLFELIEQTPNLIWMLLTKRPENYAKFMPERWLGKNFPNNVWLGASITNQPDYDKMYWPLQQFCSQNDVPVMWISAEPLLSNINFDKAPKNSSEAVAMGQEKLRAPDLVILGGESGHLTKVRQLGLNHVQNIINQLKQNGHTKIFFKQLGRKLAQQYRMSDVKGETFEQYPALLDWLKIREMPQTNLQLQHEAVGV